MSYIQVDFITWSLNRCQSWYIRINNNKFLNAFIDRDSSEEDNNTNDIDQANTQYKKIEKEIEGDLETMFTEEDFGDW